MLKKIKNEEKDKKEKIIWPNLDLNLQPYKTKKVSQSALPIELQNFNLQSVKNKNI